MLSWLSIGGLCAFSWSWARWVRCRVLVVGDCERLLWGSREGVVDGVC